MIKVSISLYSLFISFNCYLKDPFLIHQPDNCIFNPVLSVLAPYRFPQRPIIFTGTLFSSLSLSYHLVVYLHVGLASDRELCFKLPFHHPLRIVHGLVCLSKVEILQTQAFIGLHFCIITYFTPYQPTQLQYLLEASDCKIVLFHKLIYLSHVLVGIELKFFVVELFIVLIFTPQYEVFLELLIFEGCQAAQTFETLERYTVAFEIMHVDISHDFQQVLIYCYIHSMYRKLTHFLKDLQSHLFLTLSVSFLNCISEKGLHLVISGICYLFEGFHQLLCGLSFSIVRLLP